MGRIITKVKKKARKKSLPYENIPGWEGMLVELSDRIRRLQELVPIVEGKIERGEPWPETQLPDQNSNQQHSV